jgi:hypothetical protein
MTATDKPAMRVVNIALDYNEQPRDVTVVANAPVAERLNTLGFTFTPDNPKTMTVAAAAQVARHFGALTPSDDVTREIWDCLTGTVFNRFYEGGLYDYEEGQR